MVNFLLEHTQRLKSLKRRLIIVLLYAISQQDTEFKTLSGQCLKPIKFGSIKKAREFKRSYNTENAPIFGMDRYQYQYISDNILKKYNFQKII